MSWWANRLYHVRNVAQFSVGHFQAIIEDLHHLLVPLFHLTAAAWTRKRQRLVP
jgi:hypothetical protein